VPVIVDADTGFGNALNTQRTVRGSSVPARR
jgi:2-methylisocitrate lyase-like PEP mutase family enzyme